MYPTDGFLAMGLNKCLVRCVRADEKACIGLNSLPRTFLESAVSYLKKNI